jgi:hypothetical protein
VGDADAQRIERLKEELNKYGEQYADSINSDKGVRSQKTYDLQKKVNALRAQIKRESAKDASVATTLAPVPVKRPYPTSVALPTREAVEAAYRPRTKKELSAAFGKDSLRSLARDSFYGRNLAPGPGETAFGAQLNTKAARAYDAAAGRAKDYSLPPYSEEQAKASTEGLKQELTRLKAIKFPDHRQIEQIADLERFLKQHKALDTLRPV